MYPADEGMMTDPSYSLWLHLPDDILMNIFQFLPFSTLITASKVCFWNLSLEFSIELKLDLHNRISVNLSIKIGDR